MKYRKEIDGLRALAVIPVILFHAGFTTFSSGFVGVDVFFVISGYLITSIVLNQKQHETFSLISFYERRARRILPALYFMLSLASILAVIIMLPSQLKEFGQSVISTVLFSANIFFWLKTDYWQQSSELAPLLHIWSLGVEEQFYFCFPFLLILFKSKKLKIVFWITLGLSFFVMMYARASGNISEAFYLLPFRAWEFIVGAFAVLWTNKSFISEKVGSRLNLIALGVLIISFIIFNESTNPVFLFGIPVAATFLIIAIPDKNGIASYVLRNQYVVKVGEISYGLYLFHQPIFALTRIASFVPLSTPLIFTCLIVTFLLATISYKFVETPFRNRDIFSNRSILLLTVLLMSVFLSFGAVVHLTDGLRDYKLSNMKPEAQILFNKFGLAQKEREEIWGRELKNSSSNFDENNKLKILFVGDSLSEELLVASSLSKNITENAQLRRFDFDDECVKNLVTNGNEIGRNLIICSKEKVIFLGSKLLRESQVIVIAEAWLSNAKYLDDFLKLPEVKNKEMVVYLTHSFADMNSLLLYIDKSKVDYNSAEFKKFVYLNRHQRTISANLILEDIAKKYSLKTIHAYDFFCNSKIKECTVINNHGFPMIIDQTHLSSSGVVGFSSWLSDQLKDRLNL